MEYVLVRLILCFDFDLYLGRLALLTMESIVRKRTKQRITAQNCSYISDVNFRGRNKIRVLNRYFENLGHATVKPFREVRALFPIIEVEADRK